METIMQGVDYADTKCFGIRNFLVRIFGKKEQTYFCMSVLFGAPEEITAARKTPRRHKNCQPFARRKAWAHGTVLISLAGVLLTRLDIKKPTTQKCSWFFWRARRDSNS